MKKAVFAFGLVLALAAPLSSSALTTDELKAQIQALLVQIQALQAEQPAASSETGETARVPLRAICRIAAARLAQGAHGSDVTSLQEFLSEQGYLSSTATGFFGPLTTSALARFQKEHGIIATESEGGEVGARTLKYIAGRWCASLPAGGGAATDVRTPTPTPTPTPAATAAASSEEPHPTAEAAVSIRSFTGPATLETGAAGTWTVVATTTGPGPLRYRVTWGDEAFGNAAEALMQLADPAYADGPTFSHTYARAGSYAVSLLAKDAAGNAGRTYALVRVDRPAAASTGTTGGGGIVGAESPHTVCPQDVKMCPDGTMLSRTGASCTFSACPLTQAAMQLIGVTAPGAGAPRPGEIHCTYAGKTYSELQTYSVPVPCVEGTTGSVCGTKVYYCHYGAWYLKTAN